MECASCILSSVLSKMGDCLVEASIHQARYLFHFNNNVEDLKNKREDLRMAQDRVQGQVDRARRNTEEIEEDVKKWQTDVRTVLEDIHRLEAEIEVKKTLVRGRCPNWGWRYKFSRRAVKKMGDMSKLLQASNFARVSHSTTLPGVEPVPEGFVPFKPTEDAFRKIMEALNDDKINMVGLYGMGGVGKTTLAKVVVNKAEEEKLFDQVVMVTVTQNPDIKNLQGQLADSLGLKFEEESKEGRARRLRLRLKNEKKILIILDDVWVKLDLKTIGIPFGDDHTGCIVLLTTRRQQVCTDMRCQSTIPLDILNEEEGLILLRKHADISEDSPTLNDVAKEVAEECRGLPIAIVTIGNALRGKNIDEWKVVSKKLKMSKFVDIDTVDQNVYACLKLSYDYLKEDETKFCFLLCSLFPEDYEIDLEELLRYGLGLNLFQDANSIEEGRSQLCVTINILKASCLLLGAEEGFVKMHDLVRDVALWITSKGENVFMVKAGLGLTEWPKHEGLEQCTAISLMQNYIEVLPDHLVCPKLKILLLDGYYDKVPVPDDFFEEMKALKVASLSSFDLSLKSLQSLTNLVTLQLMDCNLRDLSSIKKLHKLEILKLQGSMFVELPEELRELGQLRILDVTDCLELERIPANVILSLSRLEELYIGYQSFIAWQLEETSEEGSIARLSELSKLNRLTILRYSRIIVGQRCLPKDFVWLKKLTRYEIMVNYLEYQDLRQLCNGSRILKITEIEVDSLFAFKALYERVEYLELRKITGRCENIVPNIEGIGLNELKMLNFESFDELECIIDTTQQQDVQSAAFSNLIDLSLEDAGLTEICRGGRPPRGFLENLKTLNIDSCDNMSCLFPTILVQRLGKLKQVTIYRCDGLQDVFQLEGLCSTKGSPSLLSSLASLNLQQLQNLRYIWKGPTQQVSLQSLIVVEVRECNKLRYLFTLNLARSLLQLEQLTVWDCESLEYIVVATEAEENVLGGGGNDVVLPKLRKLRLLELKNFINFCSANYCPTWLALQELDLDFPLNLITPSVVKNLRVLEVSRSDQLCNKILAQLRYDLQNLEELRIWSCEVQVIFQLEGLEQELSLPNLKVLELHDLDELEFLCKGPTHLLSLQNLKRLAVKNCNRLRHMFSPTLARNLMQLEELNIESCGELEQIIVEDHADDHTLLGLFPNLSYIKVENCDKLKSLFPVTIARSGLQKLNFLRVESASQLEDLFGHKDEADMTSDKEIVLPQLKELTLQYLASLVNFCPSCDHFIFPSLLLLSVWDCPKLTTRFSVEQNGSVHAEAEAPEMGKEDVDKKRSLSETTSRNIFCWGSDDFREKLPPYIGK